MVILPFPHLKLIKSQLHRVGCIYRLHESICVKSLCPEVRPRDIISSTAVLLAEPSIESPPKQVFLLKAFHVDATVWQVHGLLISPQCKCTFEDTANEVEARIVSFDAIDISLYPLVRKVLPAGSNTTLGDRVRFSTFAGNLLVVCPTTCLLELLPIYLGAFARVSQPLAVVVDGRLRYGRVLDRPDRREHQRVNRYVFTFWSA